MSLFISLGSLTDNIYVQTYNYIYVPCDSYLELSMSIIEET